MSENIRPQVVENVNDDPALDEFWTLDSLAEVYENAPEELVPGLVSKNLTMFQGDAGSGKSLIAADLTTAYSNGSKFLGKFDVNIDPKRPNVCYVDQDNFSHKALLDRLTTFQCDSSKVIIPKIWFRLDEPASIESMVAFVNHHKIGLIILDSIHAFHKLRDGKLEYLRDGFKALISTGASVVVLSHITKSSSAGDKKAAQGTGLLAATDYTFGMSEVEFGKFKVVPVKIRQGKGEQISPFHVAYSGESRPIEEPDLSLADRIIQHLLDVGDKGNTVSGIRKAVGGNNHAVSSLLKSMPEVFNNQKRGPGSFICLKQFLGEQQEVLDLTHDIQIDDQDEEAMDDDPTVEGDVSNDQDARNDLDDGLYDAGGSCSQAI